MNKKRLRLAISVVVIILVAAIGGVWWSAAHQPPPQFITLPNGEQYHFGGVTYGTKSLAPTVAAHVFNLLPGQFEILARKYLKTRAGNYPPVQRFDSPQLFVWFERLGTNASPAPGFAPMLGAFLANESGVAGGVESFANFNGSSQWSCFTFPVAPKRDGVVQCDVYTLGTNKPAGRVTFPNPLHGRFRQWQPEPLPNHKAAGDLEVRLETVLAGTILIRNPNPAGSDPPRQLRLGGTSRPGENRNTWYYFSLRSAETADVPWMLHSAQLSDASGNVLSGLAERTVFEMLRQPQTPNQAGWSDYVESLPGTLWPEESAWRLRLEFKRRKGFDPRELVTFKNVPVPNANPTNSVFLTNTVGGVQAVLGWPEIQQHLKPVFIISGMPLAAMLSMTKAVRPSVPREFLRAELPGHPAGVAVDFLQMTIDGQPATIAQVGPPTSASDIWLSLATIPANAKTAEITFVVQKTRTVEFLVKPPASGQIK